MPNHVTNILRFDGKKEDIDKLMDFVASSKMGEETVLFDFNNIIPRPSALDITSTVIASMNEDEVRPILLERKKTYGWDLSDKEFDEKVAEEVKLVRAYSANIKKYGHATWYQWSIANWGTKWNAYSIEVQDDAIHFETAYSTPQPVLEALSAKFPNLKMTIEYADEDIGYNCGWYVLENGEQTEDWTPTGKTATTFALETKGYDVDEYYEQQEED